MPLFTPEGTHIDQTLQDFSVANFQTAQDANLIADKLFPIVPVMKKSANYWVYDKAAYFRTEAGPKPLGGRPRRFSLTMSEDTYNCRAIWLDFDIDDEERANVTPPLDPEEDGIAALIAKMKLKREIDVLGAFMKTGVWGTDLTGTASLTPGGGQATQWDFGGATPGTFIRRLANTMALTGGFRPNKLVVGTDVEVDLIENQDYIDRVKYTKGGVVTDVSELDTYFGLDSILVGRAVQNTADENQTMVGQYVMPPKDALLVYAPDSAGLKTATGAAIFTWVDLVADAFSPTAVFRGRDDRAHTDWFQTAMAYDLKATGPELGIYLRNIVS